MRCLNRSGIETLSTRKRQKFYLLWIKAKVDQLNLVFVILNLVLGSFTYEYMSVLARCLLIVSAFTLSLLAVGSPLRFFVVSDVGIWEKPALEGAPALWNDLRLEVAEASGDGWPLVPSREA